MDLVLKPSGGKNLVLRPQARPPYYAPATVDAHQVEVWTQDIEPATGALIGVPIFRDRLHPEATIKLSNAQDSDRDVRVYLMPLGADGTPGYSALADCPQLTILCRRETNAPVIGQNAPATVDTVEIGITGFTRFARQRRVTISANANMSAPLVVLTFDLPAYSDREIPRYFILERTPASAELEIAAEPTGGALTVEGGATALPATVYLTVAHSAGVAWTPESNILLVTFAAAGGTGGSPGTGFDPKPTDRYRLDPF